MKKVIHFFTIMKNEIHKPIYIAVAFFIIIIFFNLSDKTQTVKYNYIERVNLEDVAVKDYSREGNTFVPLNNNPHLYIPCSFSPINLVNIKFSEPIKYSSTARIYYSINEDRGLSEANAFNVEIPINAENIFFELPENTTYTNLRFDYKDMFTLKEITLMQGEILYSQIFRTDLFIFGIVSTVIVFFLYYSFQPQWNTIYIWTSKKICNEKFCCVDDEYKKKLSKLYLLLSLVFGIFIIFLSPPYSMPDEPTHYTIASAISKGNFFVDINEADRTGYFQSFDESQVKWYRKVKEPYTYSNALLDYNYRQIPSATAFYPTTAFNPIGHLIAGLGMALARLISDEYLSPYYLIIIGRLTNLIFSSLIISISIKKALALNNSIFVFAMLPMTLYQCASISYDAIVLSMVSLLFAYVTRLSLSDDNYIVSFEDIIAISLSCFFLFGAKGAVYSIFTITLFAIKIKKFKNIKRYILCIALVSIIAVISYLIPNIINNHITSQVNYSDAPEITMQKEYLLNNINLIPTIVKDTFKTYGTEYFRGYIGVFGWGEKHLPLPFLMAFAPAIILAFFIDMCFVNNVKNNLRILSFISVFISFMGILISMYIYCAPIKIGIGGTLAYGTQGRYFLPLTLFGLLSFSNSFLGKLKASKKILEFEYSLVQIISIISGTMTLFMLFMNYWM